MIKTKATMIKTKATPLGGKLWAGILLLGMVGQIAWIVENMYFAKFMQYEVESAPYATTLMLILSALFATIATIIGGAITDRTGKRKLFICWGYVVWGFTVMAFALIPIEFSENMKGIIITVVIALDCLMSYVGATANDSAFNVWITDITDTTNRSKVDVILGILPLIAMAIVFAGLDSMTVNGNWSSFFLLLGAIPIVGGIIGLFLIKDSPTVKTTKESTYWKNVWYGFQKDVVKDNKMLYISLLGGMCAASSMQVYQAYLISFVDKTLGITDYILPLGVIIGVAALISGALGVLMGKYGKEKFYFVTIIANIIGGVVVYLVKFTMDNETLKMAVLLTGGILIMAAALTMSGLFIASFRDYIPKGKEGSFQGVRMCLYVLLPMIIGPIVGMIIINAVGLTAEDGSVLYPPELFLGGAVIVAFALIPAWFVRKNDSIIRKKKLAEIENKE